MDRFEWKTKCTMNIFSVHCVENGEGLGGLSQPPFFAQIPPPLDVNAVPQPFNSHVVHGCGSHVIMHSYLCSRGGSVQMKLGTGIMVICRWHTSPVIAPLENLMSSVLVMDEWLTFVTAVIPTSNFSKRYFCITKAILTARIVMQWSKNQHK